MRRVIRLPALLLLPLAAALPAAALELPEVAIRYAIDVRFDPASREYSGREEIRWTNATDATIETLPLHLYLNAFSHEASTWIGEESRLRFGSLEALLREEPDPWGFIDVDTIVQVACDGEEVLAPMRFVQPDDGNPLDRTLAEIQLPLPLAPGETATLRIGFAARLPYPIARTGGARDFFFFGQWYPKIGVIEPAGVRGADRARPAAHQFHAATEFYSDFADYDVTLRLPPGWLVGASGRPQGASSDEGLVAHRFVERAVHDVALVAGSSLGEATVRFQPEGGGPEVELRFLFPRGTEALVPRWRRATEAGLDTLGAAVGPYPYDHLTVVLPPAWADEVSGMEYPALITGGAADIADLHFPAASFRLKDGTIVHEVAHEYFYGVVANNEQEEAYLDEGFASYWQERSMERLFGADEFSSVVLGRPLSRTGFGRAALGSGGSSLREPIARAPSWLYEPGTTGLQLYIRPSQTFKTAANLFGRDLLDRVFREYFQRWAFRHPGFSDFLDVSREAGSEPLAAFLLEAFTTGRQPDFRIAAAEVSRWQAPLGRVPGPEGPLIVTGGTRGEVEPALRPREALEADGTVFVEVTDPGWTTRDTISRGGVERRFVTPTRGEVAPGYENEEEAAVYESRVRVEGPGWQHLPVDVEFRFADGTVVEDAWDGRSPWRRYRFLRPAPLVEARVDPAGRIAIDIDETNDARRIEPDRRFAADWGNWLGMVAQWAIGALTLCL